VPNLRGMTERSNDVEDGVACLKAVEHGSRFSNRLDGDGYGACFRIGRLDGEGNAFTLIMQSQNEELSRPLLASDARRFNDELPDIETDGPGLLNFEHERGTPVRSMPRFGV
jgi:hypothetical protein